MKLRRRAVVLLPLALLVAACASGSGSAPTAASTILVRVTNDLIPRAALTVRVTSTAGTRAVLGGVAPGQVQDLQFRDASYTGRYVLLAQAADGREFSSTAFTLVAGATVDWAVRTNTLSVAHP